MRDPKQLPKPPWLPGKILAWLLPDSTWQTPLGDFEEYFHQVSATEGMRRARRWYWGQSLALIPDRLSAKTYWGMQMLASYYKIAMRNLRRHKGFAFINLSGLALGLACFLLISFYVADELSYDRFWPGGEDIYRVWINEKTQTSDATYALGPVPLSSTLVSDYPEVSLATRLSTAFERTVTHEGENFDETRVHRADTNFFDVFQATFVHGDPSTALRDPSTVVLTKTIAAKYFGADHPIGKVITVRGRTAVRSYTVTGVIEDIPDNSHMGLDILVSWWREGQEQREGDSWLGYGVYTYLVLAPNATQESLEAKFPDMVERYAGAQLEERGVSYAEFVEAGNVYTYYLRPLRDIHLRSTANWNISPPGNERAVYLFAIVALAILLLACINYMNLSTARSASRAKEIGVRKVLGSKRKQLVIQMLTESTLMAWLAIIPAVLLVLAVQPVFSSLTGQELRVDYLKDPRVIGGILVFVMLVGLAAGIYPAVFLSRFKPALILKGTGGLQSSSSLFRNSLVVLQFAVSISLIVGTFVVQGQMDYMLAEDLGFESEQTIVIEKATLLGEQREAFKDQVAQLRGVEAVTGTHSFPGRGFSELFMAPEGADSRIQHNVYVSFGDHGYGQTLGLELVSGRFQEPGRSDDSTSVLVNERLLSVMGIAGDPLGNRIRFGPGSDSYPIIGVVRDFHFQSLHKQIGPFAYFIDSDPTLFTLVHVQTDEMTETLAGIEELWEQFVPGLPFRYSFLDEGVAKLYAAEQRMKGLLGAFSFLAMLIAGLGLFGLSAFVIEKRTKEIAVRKALGASTPGIMGMLSTEFAKLGLIAFVIAVPFAYLGVESWLDSFAYRMDVGVGVFALSGLIVVATTIMTTSYQASKAARSNPVDSLRYD